jgi:hypothetical protein
VNPRRAPDLPLELEDEPMPGFGPDRVVLATCAFVGLGVLLRVVTFVLNFPLWGDEAFVAVNLIRRGYWDLLQPLDYGQICPLLFLWLELTAVKLIGFSEWSLRLIPSLSSVASVFLFAHVVQRVVRGRARMLAVAVFSVAYYPIRYGAEVKPYATDLLAALILLALAIEWWRRPQTTRWLWALAAAAPLALCLSHPAVFVAGAISLALAVKLWKAPRRSALHPFFLYNLAMVATFLSLLIIFTNKQRVANLATLRSNYWAAAFPPLGQPVNLLWWLVEAHTGRMFAYPFGEARGGSSFTTLCFVTGLVAVWRRTDRALLVLALGPFGLILLAAVLGCYPYGGSPRTMIVTAPMICLLTGAGLSALVSRLRPARMPRGAFRGTVLALAGSGLVLLAIKLAYPYKSISDQNSRAFARWFWTEKAVDSELVCVKSDLGLGFNRRNWTLFRSALYLCNQKIYSPRHRRDIAVNFDAISANRPLRCVLYNERLEQNPACSAWLEEMTARFEMRNCQSFVVNEPSHRDDGTDVEDLYTVYEFVPRSGAPPSRVASDTAAQPLGR